MSAAPTLCANTLALNSHLRAVQSGEELLEASQNELYQKIDPMIQDLKKAIAHHARFNDAGMDYSTARDYILETIGELL